MGASVAAVATRRMQKLHFSMLLFHYAAFTMVTMIIVLGIETIINR